MNKTKALIYKSKRRRHSGGAIIFIVAMTLALLAALGVYAINNTTSEIRTSGYQRQATQAHYLSDLAATSGVDVFSPQNASFIDNQLRTTTPATPCMSAPPPGASHLSPIAKRCVKLFPAYIQANWNGTTAVSPTGLGNPATSASGQFRIEITESINTGIQAGYDTNNNKCFYRYTVSSFGWLQDGVAPGARIFGEEASRARVAVGPLDCGG